MSVRHYDLRMMLFLYVIAYAAFMVWLIKNREREFDTANPKWYQDRERPEYLAHWLSVPMTGFLLSPIGMFLHIVINAP